MKKKTGVAFAAAALLTAAIPMTAFAGVSSTSAVPGGCTVDVSAKYEDATEATVVYKLDVEWGSMEFTYSGSGSKVWNPEAHEYSVRSGNGTWTGTGNTLTVTNHSNAAVTADFTFAPGTGFESLSGSFSNETLNLPTAVGTDLMSAPQGETIFNLGGTLSAETTSFKTVGQITVSVK